MSCGLDVEPEVAFREGKKRKVNMERIMKTTLKLAVLICLGALAVSQASANLVINGDFESGNTGFTSGYTYVIPLAPAPSGNLNTLWDEATYTVYNNINAVHSSWTFGPAADHTTTGPGNMLIVNGDTKFGVPVWQGTLSAPLTAGGTYNFSAWVANIYAVSPAQLTFSVDGITLGSITPLGTGIWQQFSATFVAPYTGAPLGLVNINTQANGNDFVLDDISVTAVPEPTTMIAGALLLLPFGASTLRILRKR
jgi:hypothetical protein